MDTSNSDESPSLDERMREEIRQELDEIFVLARVFWGEETYLEALSESKQLRELIRKEFEREKAEGKYPIVADLLSDCTPDEQDFFFKRGGRFLLKPSISREELFNDRGRLQDLRWLLYGQLEFETRYPAAYEALNPKRSRSAARAGLYLPSFDVYILSNDPIPNTEIRNEPEEELDSFTSTHERTVDRSTVRRGMWEVRPKDLRGLLLAILSREEYNERINPLLSEKVRKSLDEVRVPPLAKIRITDLRLASYVDIEQSQENLREQLQALERPIIPEKILEWKSACLSRGSRIYDTYNVSSPRETLSQNEVETDSYTISFAAAALFLFVDLQMIDLKEMTSFRLAEKIVTLAEVIIKLNKALSKATSDLEIVTANRPVGKPAHFAGNDYWCLRMYRMGFSFESLAKFLDIQPYDSKTVQGTRQWTEKVSEALVRGEILESEEYPRAMSIFTLKENQYVCNKAQLAYQTYVESGADTEFDIDWLDLSRKIRVGAVYKERGAEIASAYLQLGSCLAKGISPYP